ncbi:four-carbon acid sugar kinase family protein [Sporosarcina newyorkensis]|uniref:four-carbon acid sugar kinase family protein n=1 Tax=Sporosarcina newyorkensis TaxID=759851 RepID=UPI001116EBAE|nr:four-carbon acid sugar kinase family protein [Sporosarcina newyorkensis]
MNKKLTRKIIVLDDDPTGAQTVQGLSVLTKWSKDEIEKAFKNAEHIFYILTNTRSYEKTKTIELIKEIIDNIIAVANENAYEFTIISRGDSTLRGHYPLELNVVTEELIESKNEQIDAQIIVPAFFEGGRYTYGNIHYVEENSQLIPVSETEFAKDQAFGFSNSNVCEWIEEKTHGVIKSSACKAVSTEELRKGPEGIVKMLLEAEKNQPIILNAICYEDLDVLSYAVLQAEAQGKKFIFQASASFVKSYAGIGTQPYLAKEQMIFTGNEEKGGLVVVGSHVEKTSRQLNKLLQDAKHVTGVEVNVNLLLEANRRKEEISRVSKKIHDLIQSGVTAVVYTSRDLVAAKNQTSNLKISQQVSSALTDIVKSLEISPKFVVAKGGITSSDIATEGLGIQVGKVIGQAAAGIPVWLTGEEAKFSNIPYIIFPGNVGEESSLLDIVSKLS